MADDLREKVRGVFSDPKYGRDPEWLRINVMGMIDRFADPDGLRAEVDRLRTERDEAREHIAYHLRDFRPTADMKATGDLAVDMVAYADGFRAQRDAAVREVAALRECITAALAALNGAPIPLGADRTRYAAAILRGGRTTRILEHTNPEQTPEQYDQDLHAWAEARKSVRRGTGS